MFLSSRLNLAILLLWLLFGGFCMANERSAVYCFKQISTEQGLSQSTVRCILNDHNGIIWIGTKNGLNKFDQYELKNYYREDSENSLPDNCINFISEDSLNEK